MLSLALSALACEHCGAQRQRPATVREIRAYWGHGKGNRKVAVNKYSGRVRWRGGLAALPLEDDDHAWWHEAGCREDYFVDAKGNVHGPI
jgi:hypothetical protein